MEHAAAARPICATTIAIFSRADHPRLLPFAADSNLSPCTVSHCSALLRTVLSRRLSGALHRRRWRPGKGGGRDELRVPDQAPLPNRPDHPAPLWPRGLERGREEQAALTRSLVVAESIQTCKTRALCCWWGRFYSRARRRWRALSSLGACRRVDEESKCS